MAGKWTHCTAKAGQYDVVGTQEDVVNNVIAINRNTGGFVFGDMTETAVPIVGSVDNFYVGRGDRRQ